MLKFIPIWFLFTIFSLSISGQSSIMGFSSEGASKQQQLETAFDAKLDKSNLDKWMQQLAGKPHHIGSPHDKANAEFMAGLFRSWGYDTQIETFEVLLPTPKVRILELVGSNTYQAKLEGEAFKEDPYTSQEGMLPQYNCFSADGDVTADLVFVNYGIPEDYEKLEQLGIDVKGKIVIAKYGRSWRGIKPKLAAEKGAIGCLIYSDPSDDGYSAGDVYPKGAFKPESGAQRGSVLDMPLYPGDPLTPGYGAVEGAKRLERSAAPTLMKIPVLPISYKDAMPLLKTLEGPVAPDDWGGGLPITYHVGPGPAKVHLKLEFNWELRPAYDIIAKMEGSVFPDQWVIRGNHHDAWVHGAADPVSGMVAVMEEARVVSELAKAGMRPKRTIIFCGWGAEEPGLLGSTEWVEHHASELREKAVAYINTDGNGRGFLGAGGSHTLNKFFQEVAQSVTDPQTGISIYDRRYAAQMVNQKKDPKTIDLGSLGSGSDYTPFIQHLGIPSINMGFGGESSGGEYHTIYDTYEHYTRFKDPGFEYGLALAKVAGRTTLRLANAEVLPFEFKDFYRIVNGFLEDIQKMTDRMREETVFENQLIESGKYKVAADPTKTFVVPDKKDLVPYLNFAPLQNAMLQLKDAADRYAATRGKAPMNDKEINYMLYQMEKKLIRAEGLPIRPWFKHQIYAPGFYTGYGVKTIPGVREAIELRQWKEAQKQIEIAGEVIKDFSEGIDAIVKKME